MSLRSSPACRAGGLPACERPQAGRRTAARLAIALMLAGSLAACGKKGPLELPGESEEQERSPLGLSLSDY